MTNRVLGTNLSVSSVGLGCMGFSHAYGASTAEREAVYAIQSAFDMGYTLFDTAEEVAAIDRALDTIPMSAVFGGSRMAKQDHLSDPAQLS